LTFDLADQVRELSKRSILKFDCYRRPVFSDASDGEGGRVGRAVLELCAARASIEEMMSTAGFPV
jgi:hypothetical protein